MPEYPLLVKKDLGFVTCLELCPVDPSLFLAGTNLGAVRLHSLKQARPLRVFETRSDSLGRHIRSVFWCSVRPGLFFLTNRSPSVELWDLSSNEEKPVASSNLNGLKAKCVTFSDFQDPAYMAVAIKNIVIIYVLKQEIVKSEETDCENFRNYIRILHG